MRTIDADALHDTILRDEKLDGKGVNWAVNRIISHILNAPTVEERPKGEWILVTERLPENDEDVLITRVYNGSTHYFIETSWFNECKFLTQDGEFELPNVVAWMPLPSPYKEGE